MEISHEVLPSFPVTLLPVSSLTLLKLPSTNRLMILVLPHFAFPTTKSLQVVTGKPVRAAAVRKDSKSGPNACFC